MPNTSPVELLGILFARNSLEAGGSPFFLVGNQLARRSKLGDSDRKVSLK
jgi:hypothetical protein